MSRAVSPTVSSFRSDRCLNPSPAVALETVHVDVSLQMRQFGSFSRSFSSESSAEHPAGHVLLIDSVCDLKPCSCLRTDTVVLLQQEETLQQDREFLWFLSALQQTSSREQKMKYGTTTKSCYLQEFFFPLMVKFQFENYQYFTFPLT